MRAGVQIIHTHIKIQVWQCATVTPVQEGKSQAATRRSAAVKDPVSKKKWRAIGKTPDIDKDFTLLCMDKPWGASQYSALFHDL